MIGRALAGAIALVIASALPLRAAEIVVPSTDGTPWSTSDRTHLASTLDPIFASDPVAVHAHVGLLVLDTQSGAPLYERAADDAFAPASTLKLVVASTALATLGLDYRERTTVSWRPPILTLHVAGDAQLRDADLGDAALAVASAGVRDIWQIAIDDSRYDRIRNGTGWSWDDLPYDYAAPVSAAALNDNAVHIHVEPGVRAGDPVVITGAPSDPRMRIRTDARTSAADRASTLDLARDGETIVITGTQPLGGAAEDLDAAVPDPLAYMRDTFAAALERARVHVRPPALVIALGTPTAPEATLWTHASPPLAATTAAMLGPSDNLMAELLLKELSAAGGTLPGTTADGIARERSWLTSIGIDARAADAIVDGSGLSPYDRIAPRPLAALLQYDWQAPYRKTLLDALPVSGIRGTLGSRFTEPALAGRIFAKTGSLTHVRALAGYVQPRCRRAVTFVFDIDDWVGDDASLAAFRARVLRQIAEAGC